MNKHIGSNFDDFLNEDDLIEEVSAGALKRVIAWQLAEAMKSQRVSKKALAERMHTSRTAVDRALDGLFVYIGEEERGIRRDPARRGTDLLKRVFGNL